MSQRSYWLNRDFVQCTDWTTLTSTNNQTCVLGIENEGNCGFGPNVNYQLCQYCDTSGNKTVSPCCFDAKTDLNQCASFGYPQAAAISPTMSVSTNIGASATSISPSGTNSAQAAYTTSNGLSGGQLAGVIVGSIVGALLLGALLAYLLFGRNRSRRDPEKAGGITAGGGVYNNDSNEKAGAGTSGWKHSSDTAAATTTRETPDQKMASGSSPSPMGGEAIVAGAAGVGAAGAIGAGAVAAGGAEEARPVSSLSNTTSTDGRGTTVPMVKDQYSGHEIRANDTVVAIYPYTASLNDELSLEPDDVLTVVRLYDDGWALGKTGAGQEGAFPMVCVTSSKGDAPRTSEDGGYTSQFTSSVDGAVTADEGFTSDARSARSR